MSWDNRELTTAERRFVEQLCAKLPPAIAREEVHTLLGGIVSPHTVKAYDLKGEGPCDAYRVGRKVTYFTRSLLEWMVLVLGVTPVGNVNRVLANSQQRDA